jgi:hypothetical protein
MEKKHKKYFNCGKSFRIFIIIVILKQGKGKVVPLL